MAFGLTVLRGQERLHEIPCHGGPDGASAHAEHVEVIVLDPLLRGEVVVDERRADPRDLVAQTDAPTPLPQIATPRSTSPATTASASGTTKSG